MASIWDSPLFQPPLIYFLILGIAVAAIAIIFLKFRKKDAEHFKGETLEEIFKKKNFDKYLDTFGRKLKKGKLFWNMGSVNVKKMVMLKTKIEPLNKKDTKVNREHSFLIFQKKKFFLFILFGSKPDYFVIDNEQEYIYKDRYMDRWVINQSVNMFLFGGIWISSLGTQSLMTELIYKNTYENDKEVETNTPKRFVWYNDLYANKLTGETLKADLEREKYDSAVQRETGTGKK